LLLRSKLAPDEELVTFTEAPSLEQLRDTDVLIPAVLTVDDALFDSMPNVKLMVQVRIIPVYDSSTTVYARTGQFIQLWHYFRQYDTIGKTCATR
jgi:hypothetical protein